jgi:soluble lytic murein transglycosylase-like protein
MALFTRNRIRNGSIPVIAWLLSANAASAQVFEVSDGAIRRVDSSPALAVSHATARAAPRALATAVAAAATRYGLAPELVDTVARQESGYRPQAVSSAGAIGVMQLMPATARSLGVDPWDPVENINGGAAYLRALLDQFDGRVDLALAAYNAGPHAVKRHEGIPPYRQTQTYVAASLSRLAEQSLHPLPNPSGQP